MVRGNDDAINRGLQPLVADDNVREVVARNIKSQLDFLKPKIPGQGFFDFESKIDRVVERFAGDGLARADYVAAALKNPALFCMKPETVAANIEGVIDRFAEDGLTRADYLKAALKQPSLFTMRSETVIGHVTGVIETVSKLKLSGDLYLKAGLKQPALFCMKPGTVIANVEGVIERFAADGLTRADYLKAALSHPGLFTMRSETVIANVEAVASHFAEDGLTCADYLKAVLKQPALFMMRPKTVIGHVNLITDLHRSGLLPLPENPRGPPAETAAVLSFMLREPRLFSLADDNLALRSIYAHAAGMPSSANLVRQSRKEVEHELAKALGHNDLKEPVSKVNPEAGHGPHARNLLLRALIREGWIKGRLE